MKMRDRQSGATVVEYVLMVALIAVAVVVAVALLGQTLDQHYNDVAECVKAWDSQSAEEIEAACK
ncbi:MAG: Flp family type IVb pilin [Gammaproteobacteria bacterium]|nr:Flp family type IVb pilin [Gammaproteobacteria bacterium]